MALEQRQIAKAVLLDENNEVLVLTRSNTANKRAGGLDFPGGKIEEGESFLEAARREIEEETGIKLAEEQLALGYTSADMYDDISWIRFLVVGRISSEAQVALSTEHTAVARMSIEEVYEKFDHPVWTDGLRYIVACGLAEQ